MNQTELDLDQMLAGMAEDVPPMPADFHDKWTNAVREEAAQAKAPAPVRISQWPRILGVAAVFVFLIGGTFIYRSTRKTILPKAEPVPVPNVTETAAVGDSGGSAGEADYAFSADSAAKAPVRNESVKADRMDSAAEAPAGGTAGESGGPAIIQATERPMMQIDEETAVNYAGDAEADMAEEAEENTEYAEDAAEESAAGASVTEEPAAETTATEAPVAEASETVPAERQGIGGFFADMGDFLLAAWPYLLIAAVPLAVAAYLKKSRKKA